MLRCCLPVPSLPSFPCTRRYPPRSLPRSPSAGTIASQLEECERRARDEGDRGGGKPDVILVRWPLGPRAIYARQERMQGLLQQTLGARLFSPRVC